MSTPDFICLIIYGAVLILIISIISINTTVEHNTIKMTPRNYTKLEEKYRQQQEELEKGADKLTIFISTHKDFIPAVKNSSVYKIIADNNQTTKNKYDLDLLYSDQNNELYPRRIGYSENSKIHYIWKNYRPLPRYVGFSHYRRYFDFRDNVPDMDEIFKVHDAILVKPANFGNETVTQEFFRYCPGRVFLSDTVK